MNSGDFSSFEEGTFFRAPIPIGIPMEHHSEALIFDTPVEFGGQSSCSIPRAQDRTHLSQIWLVAKLSLPEPIESEALILARELIVSELEVARRFRSSLILQGSPLSRTSFDSARAKELLQTLAREYRPAFAQAYQSLLPVWDGSIPFHHDLLGQLLVASSSIAQIEQYLQDRLPEIHRTLVAQVVREPSKSNQTLPADLGAALVDQIQFRIGNSVVATCYGDQISWQADYLGESLPEITELGELWIPIPFWFSQDPDLAFPIATLLDTISIELRVRSRAELGLPEDVQLESLDLLARFQDRGRPSDLELISDQEILVQSAARARYTTEQLGDLIYLLPFQEPSQIIFWVVRELDVPWVSPMTLASDSLAVLKINGYQTSGFSLTPYPGMHAFALQPFQFQSSGIANLSLLKLDLQIMPSTPREGAFSICVYSIGYSQLVISNGRLFWAHPR